MNLIIQQIDKEIAILQQVRKLLSGEQKPAAKIHLVPKRTHKMSAAGRKAISDAAKARWKKVKAEKKAAA